MNVVNITEDDLTVRIGPIWPTVFEASLAHDPVGFSIEQGSCIEDLHCAAEVSVAMVAQSYHPEHIDIALG